MGGLNIGGFDKFLYGIGCKPNNLAASGLDKCACYDFGSGSFFIKWSVGGTSVFD